MSKYLISLAVVQNGAQPLSSNFLDLIIMLLVCGIVIGRIFWPLVSKQSIFSSEKASTYAEGDGYSKNKTFIPMQALVVSLD